MERKDQQDPRLDIPSEANREKHINFMEAEEKDGPVSGGDDFSRERQKEWREAMSEDKDNQENESK